MSVRASLTDMRVLDFGCNQGGFLRLLYRLWPYREATGIDVVPKSIQEAQQQRGDLPVTYLVCDNPTALPLTYDVAFSHEVVYLLPSIEAHAQQMAACLSRGGNYFLALSCHTANPLWAKWKILLKDKTEMHPYDYSPEQIRAALMGAGFRVTIRPFEMEMGAQIDPIMIEPWFSDESELRQFYRHDFLLFEATKQ